MSAACAARTGPARAAGVVAAAAASAAARRRGDARGRARRHPSRGRVENLARRRRGDARATATASPFADDAAEDAASDDDDDASPPSSALARARRALLWRASSSSDDASRVVADVYTEALLEARRDDDDVAAAEASILGLSDGTISAALDHLAFDRLQAVMERTEVARREEVFATMRQVVVVSAGYDTRGFRIPWPRGTAVFEVCEREVHDDATRVLRNVGAKPPRGCSVRRVPCDGATTTTMTTTSYEYGDLEDALLKAGYAPDVPSVWVLQDIARVEDARWRELIEEVADLMNADSEVVGHVPSPSRAGAGGESGSDGDGDGAFGSGVVRDMAVVGVLARAFPSSALTPDGGAGKAGEAAAAVDEHDDAQLGVFHGVKQRPSRSEAEYYREQIYIAEHELGDDEGFED
jgi:O-methyltransferase involved in polyketide biosynthesis